MKQQEFVRRYAEQWTAFENILNAMEGSRSRSRVGQEVEEFPFVYRRVCQQLALARDRDYAPYLIDRLNALVLRGHQHLYEARAGVWSKLAYGAAVAFPREVRRNARLSWVAAALMCLPALGVSLAVVDSPDFVYAVLGPQDVDNFEEMYRPDGGSLGRERKSDSDFMMFGFYIRNNISIGFQAFAGGLLFGLGSVFFLVFNGVYFGAVAGHLNNVGFDEPFYSFVVGHSAFELSAIVLSGMAGLKLGMALLAPGRMTRLRALREAARASVVVVYGVISMLVVAAFIEAFWSSSQLVPVALKYAVGAVLWLLVAAYFSLMGRHGTR